MNFSTLATFSISKKYDLNTMDRLFIENYNCFSANDSSKYFQLLVSVSGIHYKNAKSNKVHYFYE